MSDTQATERDDASAAETTETTESVATKTGCFISSAARTG